MLHSEAALRSHTFFASTLTRNAFSIITWIWVTRDFTSNFSEEYDQVWKPLLARRLPIHITIVYAIARYLGLIGQTINFIWTTVLISKPPIRPLDCWRWFTFQSTIIQFLTGALHFVLMLRVSALYSNHPLVRIFLGVIWLAERVVVMYAGVEAFRAVQFDSTCLVDVTPLVPVVIMSAAIICVHIIIGGMTLAKVYGGPKCPLTVQLMRDGLLVFASVIVFYCFVVPYTFLVTVLTHSMFSFLITLLSVLGCRVILNLRRLQSDDNASRLLTTESGTWCLDTLDHDKDDHPSLVTPPATQLRF